MVAAKQRKLLRELFSYAFGSDELPTDTSSTDSGEKEEKK